MNGRIYAPQLGRMLSPDPVTQAPDNGQNYNRYSYAFNNPLKYTDPNGYEASTAAGIIANEISSRAINTLVSGLFDSLFGGKSCDKDCMYTRMVSQWCHQRDCTGRLSQVGTVEDVEYNRAGSMNQMTPSQAYVLAQTGDNGSAKEPTNVVGDVGFDYDRRSAQIERAIELAIAYMGSRIQGEDFTIERDDKLVSDQSSVAIWDEGARKILYSGAALKANGYTTVHDVAGVFVHEMEHLYQNDLPSNSSEYRALLRQRNFYHAQPIGSVSDTALSSLEIRIRRCLGRDPCYN